MRSAAKSAMAAYSLDRWIFLGSAPMGMPCLCSVPMTVFVTSGLYESKSKTFLTTLTRPSLGNFCNHNRNSIVSNSSHSLYNSVHVQPWDVLKNIYTGMADLSDTSRWWFNCECVWVSLCVRRHVAILLGAWWMADYETLHVCRVPWCQQCVKFWWWLSDPIKF